MNKSKEKTVLDSILTVLDTYAHDANFISVDDCVKASQIIKNLSDAYLSLNSVVERRSFND